MARVLSIFLCFSIATALDLKVVLLPDLEGRGAGFKIFPEEQAVNLTWCDMKDEDPHCESAYSVKGELNVTSLQPYTKYTVTAEVSDTNETAVEVFTSDYGTPSTLFNITVEDIGAFWISLSWTPMNSSKLHGPPTGYKLLYCNKTCGEKETKEPEVSLNFLNPKTHYMIRLWAFNIDSSKQRLENEEYVTVYHGTTTPDSRTSLIFVIAGSVGVFFLVVGFIVYMRRSRRNRRRVHRFNVVKSYEESYTVPSTRNSV